MKCALLNFQTQPLGIHSLHVHIVWAIWDSALCARPAALFIIVLKIVSRIIGIIIKLLVVKLSSIRLVTASSKSHVSRMCYNYSCRTLTRRIQLLNFGCNWVFRWFRVTLIASLASKVVLYAWDVFLVYSKQTLIKLNH